MVIFKAPVSWKHVMDRNYRINDLRLFKMTQKLETGKDEIVRRDRSEYLFKGHILKILYEIHL